MVFTADDAKAWHENGEKVVLVRLETSPEDIEGMHVSEGILTVRGGMTSHAAVVARGMGACCVSGCGEITVDYENKQFTLAGWSWESLQAEHARDTELVGFCLLGQEGAQGAWQARWERAQGASRQALAHALAPLGMQLSGLEQPLLLLLPTTILQTGFGLHWLHHWQ